MLIVKLTWMLCERSNLRKSAEYSELIMVPLNEFI